MKVGDKVRFLNTTGGGVVRSFKGKDQVLVEDEDGFEVPALIRECVVVGEGPQVHTECLFGLSSTGSESHPAMWLRSLFRERQQLPFVL